MLRVFILLGLVLLTGCSPSHREMLDKADDDLVNQRALLAKYVFVKIIKEHPSKDFIRFRALRGLVEVSLTQLHEYPIAVSAMEKMIAEFEAEPQFRGVIPEWRRRLSEVWRLNLQKPQKAKEALEPIMERTDLSERIENEIGLTLQSLNEFLEAESFFKRAWDRAITKQDCSLSRELQLSMIQNYSLSKRCSLALEWSEKKLPLECKPDRFSLALEKAHCLEITGEPISAIKIYEDILNENPKNMRAQFLLDNIKRREKEKVRR